MNRILWCFLSLSLPVTLAAAEYRFRAVDFPGASGTNIFAVNNRGQFVGEEQDAAGAQHAILDDGRQLQLLDDASGLLGKSVQSWAFSINNQGAIAGAFQSSDLALHGFVREPGGEIATIDYPGGTNTQAFGVNDRGTVIGVFLDSGGNNHAFILRNGHFEAADVTGGIATVPLSVNDRDEIVGQVATAPQTIGFGYLEQSDGQTELFSAPGSQSQSTFFISINNRNQILGAYVNSSNAFQNFLKVRDEYRLFNLPTRLGATSTSAQTINDPGQIVGWYADVNQIQHGFVAVPVDE